MQGLHAVEAGAEDLQKEDSAAGPLLGWNVDVLQWRGLCAQDNVL